MEQSGPYFLKADLLDPLQHHQHWVLAQHLTTSGIVPLHQHQPQTSRAFKTYSASWQSDRDRENGVPRSNSLSPAVGWAVKSWMLPEPSAQADRDDLCCTQMHPAGRNKPWLFLGENTETWWLHTAPRSSHPSCFSYLFPGRWISLATEMIFPLEMVHRHAGCDGQRGRESWNWAQENMRAPSCLLKPNLHSTPAPCWDPRANPKLHCHLPQLLNMQIPRKQETPRKEHPYTQNIKIKPKHTTYQMMSCCCKSPKHRSTKESSPCGVCFE